MGTEARMGPGLVTLAPNPGAGVLVEGVVVVVVVDVLSDVDVVDGVVVEVVASVASKKKN